MALTNVGIPPRIPAQTRVDTTADVAGGTPAGNPLQNADIASAELRGWMAGRRAERRALANGQIAQVPTAPPRVSLQVLTNVRAAFDQLKGVGPPGVREAIASSLRTGQPLPAQLQPYAGVAAQAQQAVDQFATLGPQDQAKVRQLLANDQSWPQTEPLFNAMLGQEPAALPQDLRQAAAALAPVDGPAAITVGGNLGQALARMGDIDSPAKVADLVKAAQADGMTPGQLVDQLVSGQGPVAQSIVPRLDVGQVDQLAQFLDPADAQKNLQRLDGLAAIAEAKAGSNTAPKDPKLLSGADMQKLLQGRDPLDVARALVNNTGDPPQSAMTLEALDALASAMTPTQPMTEAQAADFNKLADQLYALKDKMPATAALMPQTPQELAEAAKDLAAIRQQQAATAAPGAAPAQAPAGVQPPAGAPDQPPARAPAQAPAGTPAQVPTDQSTLAGLAGGVPQAGVPQAGVPQPGVPQAGVPQAAAQPAWNGMPQGLFNGGPQFPPSGDRALDLARAVGNMQHTPAEQALLDQIKDPQQRAMQELQMYMQKQSLIATTLSNIANMRHEMMKTVANNLRA